MYILYARRTLHSQWELYYPDGRKYYQDTIVFNSLGDAQDHGSSLGFQVLLYI